MKNALCYYYNLNIDNLIKNNDEYYFQYKFQKYKFVKYSRPDEDIVSLYSLNTEMKKNGCMVNRIILNRDSNVTTIVGNSKYVLINLYENQSDCININNITNLQNLTIGITHEKNLERCDWIKLWSEKLDYYEYQISQFSKKYPLLSDSLNYYIGLGENAISYFRNNYKESIERLCVAHKRISLHNTCYDFYNPLEMIIDFRVRDVAEYIKEKFFYGIFDENEIINYLNFCNYSYNEYIMLISRLLFPTIYFDFYDEIINNNESESNIKKIIKKNIDYEIFLLNIYNFITRVKKIDLEPIEWLKKRHIN